MTNEHPSPEGAQDLALELADALERMSLSTKWDRRVATELRRLHARVQELERERDNYKLAHNEWSEKTEWVQQTAQPRELGMHRADVLRARVQELERAVADEREACAALVEGMTHLQRVALGSVGRTPTPPCSYAAAIRARGAQGEST